MNYNDFLIEYRKYRNEFRNAYKLGSPGQNLAQGSFSFDELDIFLPFITSDTLSWLGERSLLLEEAYSKLSEQERHKALMPKDIKELDASGNGITRLLSYMEINNHEYFHALQTLTLQSVWQLAFAFQEIAHVRTAVAIYLHTMGREFAEDVPIFENLSDADYDQIFRSKALALTQRFQEIRSAIQMDGAGLSVLGLIENSAFIAQKISCRSFDFDTGSVQNWPIYSGSFTYWCKQGGRDCLAFLIAAHSALRLGTLNTESGGVSPVQIFREYAKNAREIEKSLMGESVGFSGSNERKLPESKLFGMPKPLSSRELLNAVKSENAKTKLQEVGIYEALANELGWDEDSFSHLLSESEEGLDFENTRQQKDFPARLLDTAKKMLMQLPYSMVKSISVLHPLSSIRIESDVYISKIGIKIYENIPGFYSEKYFINWLLNEETRKRFQKLFKDASFDEEPEQIELLVDALSIFEFRVASKLFKDLENILMYDPHDGIPLPKCCSVHGSSATGYTLLNCNEPDSLNSRCNRILGKPLREFCKNY